MYAYLYYFSRSIASTLISFFYKHGAFGHWGIFSLLLIIVETYIGVTVTLAWYWFMVASIYWSEFVPANHN
jgi:hypothetical protein